MKYLFLIYAAEARFAELPPAELESMQRAYGQFTRELQATARAGDFAALEPVHTATCVQVREGKRLVTDGPFAETREQLAGYYTFRAESLEEAQAWAAKIPTARYGTIEVRPLVDHGEEASAEDAAAESPTAAGGQEYLLILYGDEAQWQSLSESEMEAEMERHMAFGTELAEQQKMIAGEELDSVQKATSLRLEGERRVVRDGPFAETREQLGGYYRIVARDLDEAIEIAAKNPVADSGTVEIRPVHDLRPLRSGD